ncbi:MAG: hypothetical protein JSS96_15450 [Bacteroidetes bacterium]|nr:hypothetical protein [Bacteroidota bacterium]
MRVLISILLIALLSVFAEQHWAWWSIAVIACLLPLILNLKPGAAFLSGFGGIGLFWLVTVMVKDIANNHILSQKMAELFHLPNYILFVIVTVLIGSLIGGLAGLTGSYIRRMF